MEKPLVYCAGKTPAIRFAAEALSRAGVAVTEERSPRVDWLLLDVPSFRDGSCPPPETLLAGLPPDVTVFGGNLPPIPGVRTVDLLQDARYLAENAYITAECALSLAMERLDCTIRDCSVLIIGWGRIGQCLARLLGAMGAKVTVAARRASHRALCQAMGYQAESADDLAPHLEDFCLIVNTVPAPQFSELQLSRGENAVKLELASRQGLLGADVIVARGLPGIHMPESSGKLIARTCLRLGKEVSL